jgi:putative effector of murein hydrolase LrgA (UPF0299 family)
MKLPNKYYDFLKWFLMLFIPALITLIATLGTIYNIDTEVIVLTISAFATFLGAITGISSISYNNSKTTKKKGK